MPVYTFMALDPPLSVIKEIDKRRRAFLWKGSPNVAGGHCLVSWSSVCRPRHLGGLGLPNLVILGRTLRIRWQWLQRSWSTRPWGRLHNQTTQAEEIMFKASIVVRVGNGEKTLFWEDRWLDGRSIQGLAPSIANMVNLTIRKHRTVAQALLGHSWILDIEGRLEDVSILEFLRLWDTLQPIQLSQDEIDSVLWQWEPSGCYSAKSAYRAFFVGSIGFPCAKAIWKARAPLKCKIFLWLAIRRRCWTADRLQRRGLVNQGVCVFCGHGQETIDHILVGCAVTGQVWARFLRQVGFRAAAPIGQTTLQDHWISARNSEAKHRRKELDSCIILVSWMIWKERNQRIFKNVTTPINQFLIRIQAEHHHWRMAAATGREAPMDHE